MGNNKDDFGDRMKRYEVPFDYKHTARVPVIMRFDGNSFSKYTKAIKLDKPFDERMIRAMSAAMEAVLNYCSGAVFGYTQSDEISILLRNDQTTATQPFLGARIQKLVSLCASTLAVRFDRAMRKEFQSELLAYSKYGEGLKELPEAAFDCRLFVLPPEEVTNYFLWRQLDAHKNAISSYAYAHLPGAKKRLMGVGTRERAEIIKADLGVDVKDLPVHWMRGIATRREVYEILLQKHLGDDKFMQLVKEGKAEEGQKVTRSEWVPDYDMPWLADVENRAYIRDLLG